MSSRRKSSKKKTRRGFSNSMKRTFGWLVSAGHPKSCARKKRAESYESQPAKTPKKKSGMCVCAIVCEKKHKHSEGCKRTSVVCVCGEGKRKKSVSYKSKVRIPIKKEGSLSKFGYHTSNGDRSRHMALKKAIKGGRDTTAVSQRLHALATLNKNRNPTLSKIVKNDAWWVTQKFGTTKYPKY